MQFTGRFDAAADEDWFRIEAIAGQTYRAAAGDAVIVTAVSGSDTTGLPVDLSRQYVAFDPASDALRTEIAAFDQTAFAWTGTVFTPLDGGVYYVQTANSTGGADYTLMVDPVADDFADNTATTGSIVPGAPVQGKFEVAGDEDWLRADLAAGTSYAVTVTGVDSLTQVYAISADDQDGLNPFGRTESSAIVSGVSTAFTPRASALFFVQVDGRYDSARDYTVTLTAYEDDYPDHVDTPGVLTVGQPLQGRLEVGADEDWFKVTLDAGQTYQVLGGAGIVQARSLADGDGVFQPPGGRVEGGDHGGGVVFTPLDGGTYYILVRGTGAADQAYQIAVQPVVDDFADNAGTSGVVSLGGPVVGVYENRGDADWLAADLAAGQSYRFTLAADQASPGAASSQTLRVFSADDTDGVPANDAAQGLEGVAGRLRETLEAFDGAPHSIVVTPRADSRWYVEASAGQSTGGYEVVLETLDDDFADHAGTTGIVEPGGSVTGTIEDSGDRDWFAMDLAPEQTYLLRSEDLFGAALTVISADDGEGFSSGAPSGRYEPGNPASSQGAVTFSTLDGGRYYAVVGSDFTEPGSYTLGLSVVTDDRPDHTGARQDGGGQPDAFDFFAWPGGEQVSALYLGYFGRAGDPLGQAFWEDEYAQAAAAGQSAVAVAEDIASDFRFSLEAFGLYPFLDPAVSQNADDSRVAGFLDNVFDNLFNRTAEPEGLAFWIDEIQTRLSAGEIIGDVIIDVIAGAQGTDVVTLANKVTVAQAFTDNSDAGTFDADTSRGIIGAVDDTDGSVTAALDMI